MGRKITGSGEKSSGTSTGSSRDITTSRTKSNREYIHPLFRQDKFPVDLDWQTGFRRAARLATRLLNSPQIRHYGFAFYFGVHRQAMLPLNAPPTDTTQHPFQYSCDKGINQLAPHEKRAVKDRFLAPADRVSYNVSVLSGNTYAEAQPLPPRPDISGVDTMILLSRDLCDAALDRDGLTETELALLDFGLAMVLLHELAHATNHDLMGTRREDFFERSLIAEAGFELESRIFGLNPHLDHAALPSASWYNWQTRGLAASGYDLGKLCRQEWKLPAKSSALAMDFGFDRRLLDDDFWAGEYRERGALALVPDCVAALCGWGGGDNLTKAIPASIKDLFRQGGGGGGGGGKSYAQKRFGRSANPGLLLRDPSTKKSRHDVSIDI